jgi:tetratricopeptide (TPR) repeat protein
MFAAASARAQPKLEFNLKKPKQFENQKLPSEKMAEKKFTFLRHFFQNNYTHFNYYFNANQRLNEIVTDSKTTFTDDYTRLLSFYPYSLDQTSRSKFLDSVIEICTAGILLHDLRNDWIDNMYLALGKAYLLRKNFDSAATTFQFINYTFAPKEKGGYDKVIGSNSEEGKNAFTIATKEKKGTFTYLISPPPSRNEAFVWQIRTLTETGNYLDASSLIETLKNDPYFPQRLKEEMAEARAYLYYKMEMWDSSASYLVKALPEAGNRQDKARAWYLAGQMFQKAGNYKQASEAYAKCTLLALDPVMEIYARLNSIRLNKSSDPKIIDANIGTLLSMVKKDKYDNYRDIIYYAIALFELERNGYDAANNYLHKSIQFNSNRPEQRSRSFMQLGDNYFVVKNYANSGLAYDSVAENSLDDSAFARLNVRRPGTHNVYQAWQIISVQDSLLTLSALGEAERTALVKQISKKLRKERGLKEDLALNTGYSPNNLQNPAAVNNTAANLFSTTGTSWYFYDVNIRADGYTKFKQRWGGRPNVDNWRRTSAIPINQPTRQGIVDADTTAKLLASDSSLIESFDTTDISFDNLYSRIPVSDEKKQRARARLAQAWFNTGVALHEQIEDYPEAIKAFEKSLSYKDSGANAEQALFALIHCYNQTGDKANADRCRQLLQKNFSGSETVKKLSNKDLPQIKADKKSTSTYQEIYNLFIEGNFDKAIEAKKLADSTLGKNYWTPQLLYIESVYYIRQKEDSLAIVSLKNLELQFAKHPLAQRAKTMIEVLGRRKEIEEYLTKLEITRAKEDEAAVIPVVRPKQQAIVTIPDSLRPKTDNIKPSVVTKDTASKLIAVAPSQVSPYIINPAEPCLVAMVLEKVDPAYVNEAWYALNASSRKNFNGQQVDVVKKKLKDNLWLITFSSAEFKNAETGVGFISYLKPIVQKELLTWLDASKYSYIILSEANYNLLQQEPNMVLYQKVLRETFPGKF